MRLYADENFPQPVVARLREMGHDVLTTREAGRAGQKVPDDLVLAFAVAECRIALTLNRRDFLRLHHQDPDHHGIIFCTLDTDFLGQPEQIEEAISSSPSMTGQLLRVDRPQA